MKTKTCTKCGTEKPLSEFHKHKTSKLGVRPDCKECVRIRGKRYREINDKKIRIKRKQNKEKIRRINQNYYIRNKEKLNKRYKKYYYNNLEYHKNRAKIYRENHKEQTNKNHTNYTRERRRNDPMFKTLCNLRNRINATVGKNQKSLSTMFLLGCSIDYFMYYIQEQFVDNMNWDNYGKFGWHIDHIKPLVLFDLTKLEEQRKAFHYTNLQPLWWYDNLSKKDKYD